MNTREKADARRGRQNLFTIAPHAPFLETLALRVLDGTLLSGWDRSGPFALSDVTIILPTRRARLALADAFAAMLGGAALLPDIRTFGGAPEEEEPFLPPFDAPALPSAITPVKRKLILAQLIEAWIEKGGAASFSAPGLSGFSSPPSAGEILALAESLGELIDDCHVEGIDPRALKSIVPETLAANWQAILAFLDIALEAWPEILAGHGEADAVTLRNERLKRQAEAAPQIFGDRPVIAAGSTGSIPATASLLKAIAALPRGALVLPGLDTTLDDARFAALIDRTASPHTHPQYGLARLLENLGARPGQVVDLAAAPHPRTTLVRQALALPDDTARWAEARVTLAPDMPEALAGLSIAVARTDEEQARVIALAAREALESRKTVGIVTPDRNLARRIIAELVRFDIEVDDSAGTPLFQSRAGRLARQVLALATGNFAPVDLMALLRNARAHFGLDRASIVSAADLMEIALLRGQRPAPGLDGLRALLRKNLDGEIDHVRHRLSAGEEIHIVKLLDNMEKALMPLLRLLGSSSFRASDFAHALEETLAATTAGPEPVILQGSEDLARWLTTLGAEAGRGPVLSRRGLDAALRQLMAGVSLRAPKSARTDIAIWGQLEARLQNPGLVVLAGLSEGVWPEAADPGPWLSRGMRLAAGLEPPERRIGQAAHDFEMALGNHEVLVTRAERSGTSPATPSRLLQRLEAFIGPGNARLLEERGAIWVARARALDFAGEPKPAPRPLPKPPAALRPRNLSITEIETLIRSPYDLYAKYVLGLRKLDSLGDDPGARERGTLIHEIFSRFVDRGHDFAAADAPERLLALADETFAALEALPERRALWRARFAAIASGFLSYEKKREAGIARRHAELSGEWTFAVAGERFTLRGRADRIDLRHDGLLEILDFKTGAVPASKDMQSFIAPQLLLEAAMAREGGFAPAPPAAAHALTYIKIGAGPEAFSVNPFGAGKDKTLADAIDEVMRRLAMQVEAYLLNSDQPMAAHVYPDPARRYRGDYDHLARTGEWTAESGEEGE